MGITAEQIAVKYPIPTYRFRVSVGDEEMAFNKVTGLNITSESIEYKDGASDLYQMPGQVDATSITLRKGIVIGQRQLYDWISSISLDRVEKKNVTISLMNESGSEPQITWHFTDAFPISLTAPSFDATSNEVSIEELGLMAKAKRVSLSMH